MSNWEERRFEELYRVPSRNGLTRPSSVRGEGYNFINMGELFSNNRIYDIETELVKLNDKERENSTLEEGDLLFARQSLVYEGAGKCSIVMNINNITSFESHLIRVRLNKSIAEPLYYYYYFSMPYNAVKTIVQQCAQAGIRGTDLAKIKVPYPDLPTQKRIADVLSAYDDLIENNNKRIALLEKAAKKLYKEWFVRFRFPGYEKVKFVNGLPEGWEIEPIEELAKVGAGGDAPQDYSSVRTAEYPIPIFSNGITNDGLYGYAKNATKKAKSITISARGTVGFTCLRFEPYLPIVRLLSIEPDSKLIDVYYLYHNLSNENIDGYGTSQQQITIPYFKKKKVIVPPVELQHKYALFAEDIYGQINKLKESNINLIKQRDLLLPRLMSGKLEV